MCCVFMFDAPLIKNRQGRGLQAHGKGESGDRKCKNAMLLQLNSWLLVVVVVGGGVMKKSAY